MSYHYFLIHLSSIVQTLNYFLIIHALRLINFFIELFENDIAFVDLLIGSVKHFNHLIVIIALCYCLRVYHCDLLFNVVCSFLSWRFLCLQFNVILVLNYFLLNHMNLKHHDNWLHGSFNILHSQFIKSFLFLKHFFEIVNSIKSP